MRDKLVLFSAFVSQSLPAMQITGFDFQTETILVTIPLKLPSGEIVRQPFASDFQAAMADTQEFTDRFHRIYVGCNQSSDILYDSQYQRLPVLTDAALQGEFSITR